MQFALCAPVTAAYKFKTTLKQQDGSHGHAARYPCAGEHESQGMRKIGQDSSESSEQQTTDCASRQTADKCVGATEAIPLYPKKPQTKTDDGAAKNPSEHSCGKWRLIREIQCDRNLDRTRHNATQNPYASPGEDPPCGLRIARKTLAIAGAQGAKDSPEDAKRHYVHQPGCLLLKQEWVYQFEQPPRTQAAVAPINVVEYKLLERPMARAAGTPVNTYFEMT